MCPKIEYPGFFDGGLVGARVKEPIKHREAFLYVPMRVVIGLDKCSSHPVLGKFFRENPSIFSDDQSDWE